MDPEIAARIESLVALIWSLIGVVILLIVGWLAQPECDPACAHCHKKREGRADQALRAFWRGSPPVEFCKLHSRPLHECRDQHEDS